MGSKIITAAAKFCSLLCVLLCFFISCRDWFHVHDYVIISSFLWQGRMVSIK